MQVLVVGCGDAFGSGGRANTCFLVNAARGPFLVDCGASSLIGLKAHAIDPDEIGLVFITHLHGDHFGGLVFLLREATLYKRRKKPLVIAGPPGLEKRLAEALEVFFPGGSKPPTTFALRVVELDPEVRTEVEGVHVTPYPVVHACGAPPYALRIEAEGKVIGYSADTLWVDALIDVGRDADLFICEAYTYDTPMGSHLDLKTVLRRLPDIKPRRTILTHLGPEVLQRRHELDVEVAADGMLLTL